MGEEEGKSITHGYKPSFCCGNSRGFTEPACAFPVVDQGVRRLGQGAGVLDDDSTVHAVFDEVFDARVGDRDNRSTTALGFGNRAMTPIRSWSGEANDIHRRVESGQFFVLITGPVNPVRQPDTPGPFFELRLELAVAHHSHVHWCFDAGYGVEEEPESPPSGELPDGADDVGARWYVQSISPKGPVSRLKAVFERRWQSDYRRIRYNLAEIGFKSGVSAQGPIQSPIEVVVKEIAPDVTRAAKRADQRGALMDARDHTQEVVVREVTDDDVALCCQ